MTFGELLETIFNHLVKDAEQLEGCIFRRSMVLSLETSNLQVTYCGVRNARLISQNILTHFSASQIVSGGVSFPNRLPAAKERAQSSAFFGSEAITFILGLILCIHKTCMAKKY